MSNLPELKAERKTYYLVDYKDFENWVKERTGHEYNVAAVVECANDSIHRASVDPNYYRDSKYDQTVVQKFLDTGKYGYYDPEPGILMSHFAVLGEIEPGEYLIDISW